MLIVIKLFAEDQSELDSPEVDSPMSSSFELEEEPEEPLFLGPRLPIVCIQLLLGMCTLACANATRPWD